MRAIRFLLGITLAVSAALALYSTSAMANDAAAAQTVVDNSERTFTNFKDDPNMVWFRDHLHDAHALMIVPRLGRGGFIVGGSGGRGLIIARDKETGSWSQPSFTTIGSASIGLQIGGEMSEVIFVVMTDKGLDAMLSTRLTLGADASVAAGPVGTGTRAQLADVLSFSRSRGVFGGLTAEGSVIQPDNRRNQAFFSKSVTPTDILIRHSVTNPGADKLVEVVTKSTKKE